MPYTQTKYGITLPDGHTVTRTTNRTYLFVCIARHKTQGWKVYSWHMTVEAALRQLTHINGIFELGSPMFTEAALRQPFVIKQTIKHNKGETTCS